MTSLMKKTILVTGASGQTGGYTVPLLVERGHRVRAMVHRDDERAARLRSAGAEVVKGDFLDLPSIRLAVRGVQAAYFCYPIAPGLVEATAYFAEAARDAGVNSLVNMSQISARPDAKSNAARQHWISERVFDWAGIPVTHLRPTFFAEWLLYNASTIKRGVLALPFGQGRHAPIAAEDQAHVIAAVLETPEPHAGKIYPLFGPVEMGHAEIVAEVGRVIGRTVTYEPTPIETTKWGRNDPHLVQHLSSVAIDYRDGRFAGTNDVVSRVGGIVPTTVAAFVGRHLEAFRP